MSTVCKSADALGFTAGVDTQDRIERAETDKSCQQRNKSDIAPYPSGKDGNKDEQSADKYSEKTIKKT